MPSCGGLLPQLLLLLAVVSGASAGSSASSKLRVVVHVEGVGAFVVPVPRAGTVTDSLVPEVASRVAGRAGVEAGQVSVVSLMHALGQVDLADQGALGGRRVGCCVALVAGWCVSTCATCWGWSVQG
jgi:hypothetical protein